MAALAYVPDGLLGLRDLLHTFVDLAKERLVLSEPLKGRCHDPLHSSVAAPPGTGTSQTPLGLKCEKRRETEKRRRGRTRPGHRSSPRRRAGRRGGASGGERSLSALETRPSPGPMTPPGAGSVAALP